MFLFFSELHLNVKLSETLVVKLQFQDGHTAFWAVSLESQPLSTPVLPWEAVWDLTLKLLKAEKSAEAVAILVFRGWRRQALAKSLWPGLCGAWMYSNYLGYSNQNWLVMGYWTTADCDFGSKGTAGFHWSLSLSFSFGNRILFLHKTGEFVLVFTSVATLLIATI